MQKAKRDQVTSIVLAVICVVYYILSYQIRQTALISLTSAFIPRLSAICLFALSVVMFIRSMRTIAAEKCLAHTQTEEERQQRSDSRAKLIAALVAFAILAASILLMEFAGFVYGMVFYLVASFYCFSKYEKKNWLLFVILAIVVPVVIYLAFTRAFNLRLPNGIFDIGGGIL